MSAVTQRRKCYVFVCGACGSLDISERRHKTTCSPACRVRAHRQGSLEAVNTTARMMRITPAAILQCQAIDMLCPHLTPRLVAGELTINDAQAEVCNAFWKLLQAAAVEGRELEGAA